MTNRYIMFNRNSWNSKSKFIKQNINKRLSIQNTCLNVVFLSSDNFAIFIYLSIIINKVFDSKNILSLKRCFDWYSHIMSKLYN